MAATGQLSVAPSVANPLGGLRTVSPWLIQTVIPPAPSAETPATRPSVRQSLTSARPYSRRSAGTT